MATFIDSLPSDFKLFELLKYLTSLDLRILRNSLHLSSDLGPVLTDSETIYSLSYGLDFIKRLWPIVNKKQIINNAAKGGYLEVLKWAKEQGCDWDSYTCAYAAAGGHLETLVWAREHGCDWNSDTCSSAAKGGHLETLIWARAQGCK
jgi:hypothetical protein